VSAEIAKHKGPPVFTEEERYRMVRAIKWVDEVYFDIIHFFHIDYRMIPWRKHRIQNFVVILCSFYVMEFDILLL
jgi:Cytidylyltransferase-like